MGPDSATCPTPSAGSRAIICWTPSAAASPPPGRRRAARLETRQSRASDLMSGGGKGQATAISIPRQLPAPQAAFMNGLLARALEYDDMAMPDLHPSGAIVPLVLALCEWQRAAGEQAIV